MSSNSRNSTKLNYCMGDSSALVRLNVSAEHTRTASQIINISVLPSTVSMQFITFARNNRNSQSCSLNGVTARETSSLIYSIIRLYIISYGRRVPSILTRILWLFPFSFVFTSCLIFIHWSCAKFSARKFPTQCVCECGFARIYNNRQTRHNKRINDM